MQISSSSERRRARCNPSTPRSGTVGRVRGGARAPSLRGHWLRPPPPGSSCRGQPRPLPLSFGLFPSAPAVSEDMVRMVESGDIPALWGSGPGVGSSRGALGFHLSAGPVRRPAEWPSAATASLPPSALLAWARRGELALPAPLSFRLQNGGSGPASCRAWARARPRGSQFPCPRGGMLGPPRASGAWPRRRRRRGRQPARCLTQTLYCAQAKIKARDLRGKKKEELLKQLEDLKVELSQLRVAKVTGGAASKLSKM